MEIRRARADKKSNTLRTVTSALGEGRWAGEKRKEKRGKLSEFDVFAFRKIDQGIREIGNCD